MKIFAENFRGFKSIEIDLEKMTFLIGDNSSGKSSILYLVDAVCDTDLTSAPCLNEKFGVDRFDYFSPYFDNEEVTFGFGSDEGKNQYFKIITVKPGKLNHCEIVRCTYVANGTLLTFLASGSKLKWKIIREFKKSSLNEILEIHHKKTGYKITKRIKQMSLGNPSMIFSSLDYNNLDLEEFTDEIFSNSLPAMRLVSPVRALPERFYSFNRTIDPQGLHFATMWMDYSEMDLKRKFENIRTFGDNSGLFDDIKVTKISTKLKNSPLVVTVKKSGKEFLLNQVGIGVSQVVPVLMEAAFARQSGNHLGLLVQQPELHLHPVAQAALGSYFYSEAKAGLRGILETHSSYLLDRFRADLRDDDKTENRDSDLPKFSNDNVSILFCRNTSEGNFTSEIRISENGKLLDDPEEFHSFFVDELIRTMF